MHTDVRFSALRILTELQTTSFIVRQPSISGGVLWVGGQKPRKTTRDRGELFGAAGLSMPGAVLAGAGGYGLYSDATHQIHGLPATATLMAHIKQCTVEYQRIGEQRRKEQLPCELAEAFQQRVGSDQVKLSRDDLARVQFRLEDGRTQGAEVDDFKLGSSKLAVGATLPVIYAPDNPADVRPGMSWDTVKIQLILLVLGIPFLALGFGVSFTALLGRVFRGRGEETVASEGLAPAMQASERASSSMAQRNPVILAAASTWPRTAGPASRPSFGMRNR